jgi:crotonobetainyl-CoA:carnitine CoA-transferase CaiB-like acyl-CoA transferase
MPGPLEGIRVLDFTRYQQGPIGTVMLAELGAEVWKVEARTGDLMRQSTKPSGFSNTVETYNRGKRSMTVDVRTEQGREIALRLGELVDVVADNFRPGVLDRLGLGYEDFRARNPRIIMASASAFGGVGPLAGRPGYDVIGQAMGGVMVVQALGPDEEPRTIPGGSADQIGGTQLCVAILSALIARERTGVGQKVETSLFGSQVYLMARWMIQHLHDGTQHHERRRRTPTHTFYQARDGLWLVIAVIDQAGWDRLCLVLEAEYLLTDPRFHVLREHDANTAAIESELERLFKTRTREDWISRLAAADVPCAPVNSFADIAAEPQAWENGYLAEVDHPRLGHMKVHGVPWRFSGTPVTVPPAAPELGEDTEFILSRAGYASAEIEQLRQAGII